MIFCFNFSFLFIGGLVDVCFRFNFMLLGEIKFDILLVCLSKVY